MTEEKRETEEPKEAPKRVEKSQKPKMAYTPEEIENRYQAHLAKIQGGK